MKNAAYVVIGYCGTCSGVHVELSDEKREMVFQGVLNREEAKGMAAELEHYIKNGPRRNGKSFILSTGSKH
jgi:hypothetical protein